MTDYLWSGPEATVASAIYGTDGKTLKSGYAVIGPRTLDGISYVNLRTDATLTLPAGLSETGEQLSIALIGIWAPATAEATTIASTETSVAGVNTRAPTSAADATSESVTATTEVTHTAS